MVFYRKYRPQTIEELDSEEIREKLIRILSSKSPPHAYLFSGPKGLGKTSTARIVAKALNCEKKTKGIEPCNKCDQCISITNGTNIDVLEIDGASNRGIDEIRDLREKVRLSAARASKKVYIIDEVHMLTQEAFNALLKTLEEPPAHVVFILCTTELHKVPSTIASRCFLIAFKKATEAELVRSFLRIVKKEKFAADKEALEMIAGLSDGSFRDGVKILEELSTHKKITKELVEKKYQISNIQSQISNMIQVFAEKDAKKGLQIISKLTEQGVDMKYFMEELVGELHSLLLSKMGIGQNSEFRIQNSEFAINEIKSLIGLLSKAIGELKYAVLPQLPLELVIVEWGISWKGSRLPHVVDDAQQVRGPATSFPPASARSIFSGSPSAGSLRAVGSPSSGVTPHSDNLLRNIIDRVKTQNQSVAGVLRGCRVTEYDGKKLVIETGFKFHKDRLDESGARAIIKNAVSEITGKEVSVSILLKEK